MRRPRGRSMRQIEGVERLETRITPTVSPNVSLIAQVFTPLATSGVLGAAVTESIEIAGGRAWGDAVSDVARIPRR